MSSEAQWYRYYGDIPHSLDYPDISMYRMVENSKNQYGNYIAYDFQGRKVSYTAFAEEIDICAKALLANGVKKGEIVTICLPNIPQAVVMFYAVNKIGAVASMVHPLSAENEIKFYLDETKSKLAITLSQFCHKFETIIQTTSLQTLVVTKIEEALPTVKGFLYKFVGGEPKVTENETVIAWKNFLAQAANIEEDIQEDGKGEEAAVILFSGGTTGVPKGILLTNLNFNALAMQTAAACGCLQAGDVMLSVMPVFHGFGLGVGIHTILAFGCQCVLIPQVKVEEFAGYFKKYHPNYMAGVPTLFEAMMRNKDMNRVDMSYLKGLFSGGDSLSVELKKKVDAFLKEHGATIQVREGYGTTECVTGRITTVREASGFRSPIHSTRL